MEWNGVVEPSDEVAAKELYRDLDEAVLTVISELNRSIESDTLNREEFDQEVYTTAKNALFGSLLRVATGRVDEFERWVDEQDDNITVQQIGGEHVDHVTWHRFENDVVAATYQHEPAAARGTLRRYAFNRLYRPVLTDVVSDR